MCVCFLMELSSPSSLPHTSYPLPPFSSFQGMPGENEKQPGQAPEQIPPGWRQYARESSEHPPSTRVDGRRVECFAINGKLSRGLGSGQAGICVFGEGVIAPRTPSVLSLPIS